MKAIRMYPIMLLATNRPIATTSSRGLVRSSSARGAERRLRRRRSSSNTGLSATLARTNNPTPISTIDSRNGIRHPQSRNWAGVVVAETMKNTRLASRSPSGTPSCGSEP
jgi:hypothetical protein